MLPEEKTKISNMTEGWLTYMFYIVINLETNNFVLVL